MLTSPEEANRYLVLNGCSSTDSVKARKRSRGRSGVDQKQRGRAEMWPLRGGHSTWNKDVEDFKCVREKGEVREVSRTIHQEIDWNSIDGVLLTGPTEDF